MEGIAPTHTTRIFGAIPQVDLTDKEGNVFRVPAPGAKAPLLRELRHKLPGIFATARDKEAYDTMVIAAQGKIRDLMQAVADDQETEKYTLDQINQTSAAWTLEDVRKNQKPRLSASDKLKRDLLALPETERMELLASFSPVVKNRKVGKSDTPAD